MSPEASSVYRPNENSQAGRRKEYQESDVRDLRGVLDIVGGQMAQLLWKISWYYFLKLKIHILYDTAILFLRETHRLKTTGR